MKPPSDPVSVVQRQLDAYNASDVEGILATGTAALRERFAARFQEPNLHAQLLHRTVLGNKVIDHEEVTRTFPEGPGKIELLAIYEVQDGKIWKAWFMSGPKTVEGTSKP